MSGAIDWPTVAEALIKADVASKADISLYEAQMACVDRDAEASRILNSIIKAAEEKKRWLDEAIETLKAVQSQAERDA